MAHIDWLTINYYTDLLLSARRLNREGGAGEKGWNNFMSSQTTTKTYTGLPWVRINSIKMLHLSLTRTSGEFLLYTATNSLVSTNRGSIRRSHH